MITERIKSKNERVHTIRRRRRNNKQSSRRVTGEPSSSVYKVSLWTVLALFVHSLDEYLSGNDSGPTDTAEPVKANKLQLRKAKQH